MTSQKENRARYLRLSIALITITILITLSSPARADVVTDWNQTTLATQSAEPGGIRTPLRHVPSPWFTQQSMTLSTRSIDATACMPWICRRLPARGGCSGRCVSRARWPVSESAG